MNKAVFSIVLLIAVTRLSAQQAPSAPENLRVNYITQPLNIDVYNPRFSWILFDADRNEMQSAYEIVVASTPELIASNTGDLWSTGKVTSSQQNGVVYNGTPLESKSRYWWKVRTWDKDNLAGEWSEAQVFETSMIDGQGWSAQFITGEINLARKEFTLPAGKNIERARAYVTSRGWHELSLNGEKVSDHIFGTLPVDYIKSPYLYPVFDVTEMLIEEAPNAMGLMLATGHRHQEDNKIAVCQLEIWFTDGTSMTVVSDESWKTLSGGPIIYQHVFHGEHYDAREELPGWNLPGFDDTDWTNASTVAINPEKLRSQTEPILIHETFHPVSVNDLGDGVFVFDFGRNISGWVEMTVEGDAGTEVVLTFGERAYADGRLNNSSNINLMPAEQKCRYILKGGGVETWEPRFTYHGFRFMEVKGFPGVPAIENFRAKFIYSDITTYESTFTSSNDLFNRLFEAYRITQLGNMMGIPTDCNQRAEREGWLADAAVTSESALLYFDALRFYEKYVDDILHVEAADGNSGVLAPGGGHPEIIWGSASVTIPWDLYNNYGDTFLIEKVYERCKRFVNWISNLYETRNFIVNAPPGLGSGIVSWNDWLSPIGWENNPSNDYMGTVFYFHTANIVAQMASILGNQADYITYSTLAGNIRDAINRKYLHDQAYYDNNAQSANALALFFGIVPQEHIDNVVQSLVDDITERQGHLSTGCQGTRALLPALSENGRVDKAFAVTNKTDFPSLGYMISVPDAPGTFWEHWDNKDFSKNHPFMGGSTATWLFHHVAGIKPLTAGFDTIRLKPGAANLLDSVHGNVACIKGNIISSWKNAGDLFHWHVHIPVNVKGYIYFPVANAESLIVEGTDTLWNNGNIPHHDDFIFMEWNDGFARFIIGSGSYDFVIESNLCNETQRAYKEHVVPGMIEAEDYDAGCQGQAFYDSFIGNTGGFYRPYGVDIVETAGGYAVTHTQPDEWMEYTIEPEDEGVYQVEVNASAVSGDHIFFLKAEGNSMKKKITAEPTGGAENWVTYPVFLSLYAKEQTIRLGIEQSDGELFIDNLMFSFIRPCTPQNIIFDSIPDVLSSAGQIQLEASATSDLSVSFAVKEGPGEIDGNILTLTHYKGSVEVWAYHAGTQHFCPDTAIRVFNIIHDCTPQVISLFPEGEIFADSEPFLFRAINESGEPVTLTYLSGPASYVNDTLFLTGYPGNIIFSAYHPGNENYCEYLNPFFTVKVSMPHSLCTNISGFSYMEKWNNVPGAEVNDIPLSTPPDQVTELTSLEIEPHGTENYGVRIRGFLCAPYSADYTFYIASDDQSELWLNTDSTKTGKKLIASVPHWVNSREFSRFPEQQSDEITLIGGQKYYFEVLMKQGLGGAHLSVKWVNRYGLDEIISGSYLSPHCSEQEISMSGQYTALSDSTFKLDVFSSSGLPVSLSVISGPATISGDTLTLLAPSGRIHVRAKQDGNEEWCRAKEKAYVYNISGATYLAEYVCNNEVFFYPNPASDEISIYFDEDRYLYEKGIEIQIRNLQGSLIKSYLVSDANPNMNISDISRGLYLIKIIGQDHHYTQKLIKL